MQTCSEPISSRSSIESKSSQRTVTRTFRIMTACSRGQSTSRK
jgi:hypothetical protein